MAPSRAQKLRSLWLISKRILHIIHGRFQRDQIVAKTGQQKLFYEITAQDSQMQVKNTTQIQTTLL